jgi:hypothetical protein
MNSNISRRFDGPACKLLRTTTLALQLGQIATKTELTEVRTLVIVDLNRHPV